MQISKSATIVQWVANYAESAFERKIREDYKKTM